MAGDELDLGGGVKFKVYAPEKAVVEKGSKTTDNHDPNNESVVGKLIFGEFAMMFTGDAEKVEEMPINAASFIRRGDEKVYLKTVNVSDNGDMVGELRIYYMKNDDGYFPIKYEYEENND